MIYFNKTFLHFVGLPENIEGILPWEEFVPQEDLNSINEVVKKAFEKKEFIKIEHRITRFDGEVRWVLATGKPRYLQGEFKGYIGSNIDITDRKTAEESLEIKNAQLQRINNDLDNFIYTASHDLKAPILNIEGLIKYLENSLSLESNNAAKPLISMIHKSIDRFKNTIKDLTEIAKVQNNLEEDQSSISFSEILDEVKLNIHNDIKEANALIEHDFSAVPNIYFSQKNIRSILYNLLSNAIKYRSPNRQVAIYITSAKAEDNYILLSVKDNGLGIKEEDQTKMFTMFKRLHQHVEGTGIGLSIVKKMIDNNDGKIEVESVVGEGTTLKVYFKVY